MSKPFLYAALAGSVLLVAGCDSSSPVEEGDSDAGPMAMSTDAGTTVSEPFVGHCDYTNTFSNAVECREYRGAGWPQDRAEADCRRVFPGASGEFATGPCELADELGRCVVGDLEDDGYVTVSAGDPSACGATQNGCETFGGGSFEPSARCAENDCTASDEVGNAAIMPREPNCRPPLDGEPPGLRDGLVCTPVLISGSTEEGRYFPDYADCSVVRSQRPYYATDPARPSTEGDPRLDDASYMAELDWVREQAESSACTCCHSASATPRGAADWDTEAGRLWIDTVSDEALAMFGGFTDSAAFGYLPAEENNGFDRSTTGLPTTDRERLVAFVERELLRRGVTVEQARELEPFGPFFQELIDYEPEACEDGIGIDSDGMITWKGGGARYITVLEADAASPGTPPNWNLPEGTLWSIAVPHDVRAFSCDGIRYGELPSDAYRQIPESDGEVPSLVSGSEYYLYVQADIAQPITRCLFVAP